MRINHNLRNESECNKNFTIYGNYHNFFSFIYYLLLLLGFLLAIQCTFSCTQYNSCLGNLNIMLKYISAHSVRAYWSPTENTISVLSRFKFQKREKGQ